MTKTQYVANITLFPLLTILNFFMYGVNGVVRFVQKIKEYSKKDLTN